MKKFLIPALLTAAFLFLPVSAQAQKVSILGDSYSTFQGYIPEGNATWYFNPYKPERTDVTSVEQTWWWQVIERNGYTLEVNDSWSGSTISYAGYNYADFSDRAFSTRIHRLGQPDILLIFGGTNDSWAGVPVGKFKYGLIRRKDLYTYRPGLAKLLKGVRKMYPDTKVLFIINDGLREEIVSSTQTICNRYKVPYVDLQGIDKMSGHPSIAGMKQIADQVDAALKALPAQNTKR